MGEIKNLYKSVESKLGRVYQDGANRYNLRCTPLVLQPGQIVWMRNFRLSGAADYYAAKLVPKFVKCKVLRRLFTNVYELGNSDGRNVGTWHIKDIKTHRD